ncbi:unnamed protein product [Caenorhabditis brenneri]
MSSKALSKKTLGIENQTWIVSSTCLIIGITVIRLCLGVTETIFAGDKYNKYDNALIYAFFITFFFLNPFIFEYFRLAENAAKDFKFSIGFHFFSAPVTVVYSYFITHVLWRMSKVKPDYDGDEPYLTWIVSSMCLYVDITIIQILLMFIEALFVTFKSNIYDFVVTVYIGVLWMFIALGLVLILGVSLDSEQYRKLFIVNLVYSFFILFFYFNPFIFEYVRLAEDTTNKLKCNTPIVFVFHPLFSDSLIFHFFSAPIVLANSYFITYVLWRMSKVKPDYDGDEPYLVIYGGEGSETKKLLDCSE